MTLSPGLQAIRERAEKATAGPWAAEKRRTTCGYVWRVIPIGACLYVDSRGGVCNSDMDGATAKANAEMLAASRTDVPALLDLIETLAGALEAMRTFPQVRELFAPEDSLGSIWAQGSTALDKYREFK